MRVARGAAQAASFAFARVRVPVRMPVLGLRLANTLRLRPAITLGLRLATTLGLAVVLVLGLGLPIVLAPRDAARADSGPAFFPTPPPGVAYKTLSGVLIDYAVGMKAGSLTIRVSSGARAGFLIGASMSINGKAVHCLAPPNNGQSPPPELCPDWPAGLKIGTSTVTVYYWVSTFQGARGYVTDKLTSP